MPCIVPKVHIGISNPNFTPLCYHIPMNALSVLEDADTFSRFCTYISSEDSDWDSILAKIPGLMGVTPWANFYCYRALGLPVRQALDITGIELVDYYSLLAGNPTLEKFEKYSLPKLQRNAAHTILQSNFIKNMFMFLVIDQKVIHQGLTEGLDNLPKPTSDYLRMIRKNYTPTDLLALEKIINPEKHQEKVVINLSWGNDSEPVVIEGTEASYKLIGTPDDYPD